jgi:TonB family protein
MFRHEVNFVKRIAFPVITLCLMMTTLHAQTKAVVQPPRVVSVPTPDCSQGTDCHDVSGTVVLSIGVNGDASVADVKVVSGDPRLQAPAVEAAKGGKYEPVRLNGVVTYARLTLSIRFK